MYPEHIFYPKFKKIRWLTELTTLMTETQTDSVYHFPKHYPIYLIPFSKILTYFLCAEQGIIIEP